MFHTAKDVKIKKKAGKLIMKILRSNKHGSDHACAKREGQKHICGETG
jgi:hypothetical protein